jgi:hypothetical protein
VLSSTSNSDARIPAASWSKVWILGLVLFATGLAGWECFWRCQGFQRFPKEQSVRDWALLRKDASLQGKEAVVLVGSSRILTDIDTKVFAETTGVQPVQLGVSGASPLPVLQSLADDKSFHGTVICDFHEVFVYTSEAAAAGKVQLSPDEFLKAYQGRTFLEDLLPTPVEVKGKKLLSETFVFQLQELSLSNVIHNAVRGKLPPKPVDPRSIIRDGISIDISNMQEGDIDRLQKHFEILTMDFIRAGGMSPNKLPEITRKVENMIEQIQHRGGKVILLCLPMSGKLWEINETYFPKKEYWDFLAANTTAQTIHFKDYASLSLYDCPDDSHLSRKDAPAFTKSLIAILYANQQNNYRKQ